MERYFYLLILAMAGICCRAQEVQDYKVEVGQFDKLKVLDDVNVVYRCLPDSSGFAQYRGEKEFADAFIITPKPDGTLKIQVSTEDVGNPRLPVLYVYSDFLTSVENSSAFSVLVEDPAPCAEFKATQIGNGNVTVENLKTNKLVAGLNTGNGTVNVSGTTVTADLKMLGTGMISADRLRADDVNCKILGSGSIGCWPLSKLSVKGIGSTKIYYKGSPEIKKTGGGKLFPLPEERAADTMVYPDDTEELEESDRSDLSDQPEESEEEVEAEEIAIEEEETVLEEEAEEEE